MLIEKINDNQIKIILDLEDLTENKISLHAFMCNSNKIENLFSNILKLVDKEFNFDVVNYEIITETFSLPVNNSFIMLISRVPRKIYLHPTKKNFTILKANKSFWLEFNNLQNLCMFCKFLTFNIPASLYFFDNKYFLHISANSLNQYFKLLNIAFEFSNAIFKKDFFLNENAKTIIKNCAIQTAQKYFA